MTSSPTWNSLGEFLDVAVGLGRVQAEQGVVPLPSFVGSLREVLDADQRSVRSRELPDDPTVDDLVGHRSKKGRSTVALPRTSADHPSSGRDAVGIGLAVLIYALIRMRFRRQPAERHQ